jgi:hypothetical protein
MEMASCNQEINFDRAKKTKFLILWPRSILYFETGQQLNIQFLLDIENYEGIL